MITDIIPADIFFFLLYASAIFWGIETYIILGIYRAGALDAMTQYIDRKKRDGEIVGAKHFYAEIRYHIAVWLVCLALLVASTIILFNHFNHSS